MATFIAAHPHLWAEDIGEDDGVRTPGVGP